MTKSRSEIKREVTLKGGTIDDAFNLIHLQEAKDKLESRLATIKDVWDSYLYSAPEMREFWLNELTEAFESDAD